MHGYCTAKLFRIQIQLNINRLQDLADLCGCYNTEKLFDRLLQIAQLVQWKTGSSLCQLFVCVCVCVCDQPAAQWTSPQANRS
jgi:hypothetical protein